MGNINKAFLMILDGWGIGNTTESDLVYQGETPNWDKLIEKYPHSQLLAIGENVGLPKGVMGNSEVGHLNIGAGRVIYQDLVKINKSVEDGTIKDNKLIREAFEYAKKNNKAVHFIGLLSDAGVHSMNHHLFALCDMTKDYGLDKVYVHPLTDGRDTDPKAGKGYIEKLIKHLKKSNGQIATVTGRYYTMDRDKRWERIKVGYDVLLEGKGTKTQDIPASVQASYDQGVTDEFIKPIVAVDDNDQPVGKVQEGDVFFCYNFRTDRLREITVALTQKDMPEHGMKRVPLHYITMTRYDESFKNINVAFDKENVKNSLGEVISKNGLKQIRIAETEKYAHVTFFFSGGREEEFEGENRILIPSPKVATYDLQPEMSAYEVKDAIIPELKKQAADFVCLNFANADMVGHTGVKEAILKAVNAVDTCVGEVVETARKNGYSVLIIADHGNADFAMNDNGSPNTAHSFNPVPCLLVSDNYEKIHDGILADVAPTILKIMGLEAPEEMKGKVLVE
jgi:2,3-bisphosphoglycerate-independent phosphoglycerate mutase